MTGITKHVSYLEINLDNVIFNYRSISDYVHPAEVIPVLKGNAYGHGAIAIARVLVAEGCKRIAVGKLSEAQELLRAGINPSEVELIVMSPLTPREIQTAVKSRISIFIGDFQSLECFKRSAHRVSFLPRYHIKVDTGLGRMGFLPDQAKELQNFLSNFKHGILSGVATHLSSPGDETGPNWLQKERFEKFIVEAGIRPDIFTHLASSAAVARFPELLFKGVRVGDLIYGFCSVDHPFFELKPVLSYFSHVVEIKDLPTGWTVGYNCQTKTTKPLHVAIIPIGTTDGLSSAHAGKSFMLLKGSKCLILATFADVSIIDISHLRDVRIGDQVVFIGIQSQANITAFEQSKSAGIGFSELLAKISLRVPRVYTLPGKSCR